MDNINRIFLAKEALKLVNEVEDDLKEEGLKLLDEVLGSDDSQLAALGYREVIFKELIRFVKFEEGKCLKAGVGVLETHYYTDVERLDDIAETLIYRVASSSNQETCMTCLEKISSLMDYFDDSVAKHSKQILKLADLNDVVDLNSIISEIINKMRNKLPTRRS